MSEFNEFVLLLRSLKLGDKVNFNAAHDKFSREGSDQEVKGPTPVDWGAIMPGEVKMWVEDVFNPIFSGGSGLSLQFVGLQDQITKQVLSLNDLGEQDLDDFGGMDREDNFHILIFEVQKAE